MKIKNLKLSKLTSHAKKAGNKISDLTSSTRDAASRTVDSATEMAGKVKDGAGRISNAAASKTADTATEIAGKVKNGASWVSDAATARAGEFVAFFHTPDLLKWSESITKGPASIYDKAMDAEYLRSHIGGGDHRLFDGGHDLIGAWKAVQGASDTDTFSQEVIGYVTGLWKDLTTVKGLPIKTIDKADFDVWKDRIVEAVPGVDRKYLVDMLSIDAFEVLAAGLGAVGVVFALKKDDRQKLAEILGAMGISTIIAANPLMGLVTIALTAYAYYKHKKVDVAAMGKGAAVAGISAAIFSILGLPILVELVIVIVVGSLVKKHLLNNDVLYDLIERNVSRADVSLRELISNITRWIKPDDSSMPSTNGGAKPWRRPGVDSPDDLRRRHGRHRARRGGRRSVRRDAMGRTRQGRSARATRKNRAQALRLRRCVVT